MNFLIIENFGNCFPLITTLGSSEIDTGISSFLYDTLILAQCFSLPEEGVIHIIESLCFSF